MLKRFHVQVPFLIPLPCVVDLPIKARRPPKNIFPSNRRATALSQQMGGNDAVFFFSGLEVLDYRLSKAASVGVSYWRVELKPFGWQIHVNSVVEDCAHSPSKFL